MNHWLVKQEPEDYSWNTFVAERRVAWTGVRNFQARKNLRAMKPSDLVLFYHSGEEKCVVGIARVAKAAYRDSTAEEGDWVCVDLAPVKPLLRPVSLQTIKAEKICQDMALVRQARLSVMPLSKEHFSKILALGETRLEE